MAFDIEPPTAQQNNPYFAWTFGKGMVMRGDGAGILRGEDISLGHEGLDLCKRTLVIIWPNNPDAQAQATAFRRYDLSAAAAAAAEPWDVACLRAYHAGGGRKVVYVGERAGVAHKSSKNGIWGISASQEFQELLSEQFELLTCTKIPTWPFVRDDMTVWTRKLPRP